MTDKNRGTLFVLSGCIMWGAGFPLWKLILEQMHPLALLAFYTPIVPPLVYLIFRISPRELGAVWRRHWPFLCCQSLLGACFGALTLFYALARLNAGVAAVLEYLQPVFTILFARAFLGERLSGNQLFFGGCALLLSYPIVVDEPGRPLAGSANWLAVAAGITSAICYAMSTIFGKILVTRGVHPNELTFFRMGIASLVLLPLYALWQPAHLQAEVTAAKVLFFVLVAIGPGGLAFVCYFQGLRYLPAGVANLLELTVPVIALVLGSVFLAETYTHTQILAVPFFLFCIWRVAAGHTPAPGTTVPPS